MIYGYYKKIKWVDFYHRRLVVFTHCGHTSVFKHLIKVNFANSFKAFVFFVYRFSC